MPSFYNKGKENEKICLSFFITIAYEDIHLNILNINLICMPNGNLSSHYGSRVLQAGKNLDKTRFNFSEVSTFELLENSTSRVKVVYFDKSMSERLRKSLSFYEAIYDEQADF